MFFPLSVKGDAKRSTNSSMADILSVEIKGISEAIGNMTERLLGVGEPVVKLTVELDKDGFVSIPEAIVWGDVKDDTIVGQSASNTRCVYL